MAIIGIRSIHGRGKVEQSLTSGFVGFFQALDSALDMSCHKMDLNIDFVLGLGWNEKWPSKTSQSFLFDEFCIIMRSMECWSRNTEAIRASTLLCEQTVPVPVSSMLKDKNFALSCSYTDTNAYKALGGRLQFT